MSCGPWWPDVAPDGTLRQPDQRSCGAAVLVRERMLRDPAYSAAVQDGVHPVTGHRLVGDGPAARFAREVVAMHRRVTGVVDATGRLQVPWPRALGTPPWAVAGQLTGSRGVPHLVRPVRLGRRRAAAPEQVRSCLEAGWTVPLYVGSPLLPRHVVLVVGADGDALHAYDPARGRRVRIVESRLVEGRLDVAGWSTPWCLVLASTDRSLDPPVPGP